MSQSPDEIRADIARTRAELSDDVNTLTYEANPKTIARRQVGKVRSSITGAKDKVMGKVDDLTPSSSGSSGPSSLSSAGSGLSNTASTFGDAVTGAPDSIKSQTQGNPLAAGLIAFGVGALIGSILPATAPEQQAAEKVKDAAEPLKQQLTDAATETAQSLKEPAQQAVESVKSTAADAAATVKEEGTSAPQDVKAQSQDSAKEGQDTRS